MPEGLVAQFVADLLEGGGLATVSSRGSSAFDASVEAARVRLRPIVMTSLAYILGVFPLVMSSRSWRRNAPHTGYGGLLRADWRHHIRDIPHARLLVHHSAAYGSTAEPVIAGQCLLAETERHAASITYNSCGQMY